MCKYCEEPYEDCGPCYGTDSIKIDRNEIVISDSEGKLLSWFSIDYCPWCGEKLKNKEDTFNDTIKALESISTFKNYTESKEKLFDLLFAAKHTNVKEAILHFISKHDLLPYGSWYDDSPECFGEDFWNDFDHKYEQVNFSLYCEGEENWDSSRFGNITYSEFIDQVFDFVKEKRIIGTHFDW